MSTTKHKHHELMALYAEDAAKTDTPWLLWEKRLLGLAEEWEVCESNPAWALIAEYRRAPKRINIGGHSFPEPVREALEDQQEYWQIGFYTGGYISERKWNDMKEDFFWLKSGLIQLTKSGAEEQLAATLALYRGEVEKCF